jgi:hypothetical protein
MRIKSKDVDQVLLRELADLIHNTAELQGWGCYHPGAGLSCCVGMARVIIKFFEERKK